MKSFTRAVALGSSTGGETHAWEAPAEVTTVGTVVETVALAIAAVDATLVVGCSFNADDDT